MIEEKQSIRGGIPGNWMWCMFYRCLICFHVMCCDWGRNYWMQNAWDAIHLTCAPANPEYTEWVSAENQSIPLMKRAKMKTMKRAAHCQVIFFRKKMSIFYVLNSRHEITMKSPPSFTIKTQHVHGPPFKLSRNRGNILSAPYFFYL